MCSHPSSTPTLRQRLHRIERMGNLLPAPQLQLQGPVTHSIAMPSAMQHKQISKQQRASDMQTRGRANLHLHPASIAHSNQQSHMDSD